MTSEHRAAASSSLQRFDDYLDGLREEFDLQSNAVLTKSSGPRRFNIYLRGLKGEFELMSLEIELLRKEREYKEKVNMQLKELQNTSHNLVCQQCSKEATSTPQILATSQMKASDTAPSSSPKPVFQSQSLHKPGTFSRVTNPSQQTIRRSSQHVNVIRKPRLGSPSSSMPHSKTVNLPSPLPPASALNVDPDSGPKRGDQSITFNNKVEKGLNYRVDLSYDGKYLAAACLDGKAYIYDVQTGSLTCGLRNLLAEKDLVSTVCFSRDGKYLATGSGDAGIYIWEMSTKYVRNAFKGHARGIRFLDFSPNGRLLVSTSDDNTVRLWNVRDGAAKFLTEESPTFIDTPSYFSAVFDPYGRYVAASHRDGIVRIWDVHTGQMMRRLQTHMACVNSVAFMPDGKGVVSGIRGNTVKYWDVSHLCHARFRARSQAMSDFHSKPEEQTRAEQEFSGHTRYVRSLAISPDNRWVASGSSDRSVRIWDTRNTATQCILIHEDRVRTVDFSPAGSYLASGQENGTVRIWRYSRVTELGNYPLARGLVMEPDPRE